MNNKIATITVLTILLTSLATAQSPSKISVSPENFDVDIDTSGENYKQELQFTWQGEGTVTIYPVVEVSAENTNTEGISASMSNDSYKVERGETVSAELFVDTVPSLKPDTFYFKVEPVLITQEETKEVKETITHYEDFVDYTDYNYSYLEPVISDGKINGSEAARLEEVMVDILQENSEVSDQNRDLNRSNELLREVASNRSESLQELKSEVESIEDRNSELSEKADNLSRYKTLSFVLVPLNLALLSFLVYHSGVLARVREKARSRFLSG